MNSVPVKSAYGLADRSGGDRAEKLPGRYDDLLQQAGDGILVVDSQGCLAEINAKACEVLGYRRERLLGKPIEEIRPVAIRPRKRKNFENLERQGAGLIEMPLLKSNGDSVLVEINVSRVNTLEGPLYLGIFRDVSARKQMEAEVRRRNKELFVLNSIAKVISRSLDPQDVLSNGLEKVLSLLDIEAGYMVLLNEETGELEMAVHRGLSLEFVQEYSRRPLRVGEGITGQVFVTGQPVLSRDASVDPRVTRAVVRKDQLKSSLNIPLKAKDRVLGVLMVVSFGIREFSTWDIELLTTIGNEIGVCLENSRLYRDVQQRSREVLSLLHLSNELNRRLEPESLLGLVAEKARELVHCRAAVAAFVEDGRAHCCKASGTRRQRTSWYNRPIQDELFPLSPEEAPHCGTRSRLGGLSKPRSVLALPMLDSRGKPLGLVELYDREDREQFTRKDAELISALAAQASIAFEKSRLFKEIEREVEFVANVVDNMASGLVVTDASGVIQRVNRRAAEMMGTSEEGLRGQVIQEWLAAGETLTDLRRLPCSLETELRVAPGGSMPVKILGSVRVDDSGRPLGMILILEDLQQIRLLKSKEQERERLATIGEVVSGIAHEIRNPLFGISSVAQILRMEAATRAEHRPLLDAMMSEIERINRMVEELLFYGRPSSLVLTEVDLEALWKSIVLLTASEIEARQLRVETFFPSRLFPVVADMGRLRQVFLNLLKNAIEATPSCGEIRIEAEPSSQADMGEGVLIQVHDNGTGIAPEKVGKIFELFYSEKRGGSGLGLPICKKIVEDHGGRIDVESDPAIGSTFKIWLPARPRA